MKIQFLLVLFFLLVDQCFARDWKRIYIPGAKCGNGSDYSVFLDMQSSKKLVVEFMGGGACWNASTCYGPSLKTWIFPIPEFPALSVLSSKSELAKDWSEYSYLFFPYCTGDAYVGNHSSNYLPFITTYHYGKKNVELTMAFLNKQKIIDFKNVDDLLVWGASAGAIGSLVHTKTIDKFIRSNGVHKVIIADSPGLHFGQSFWNKFSEKLFNNFKTAFGVIGLKIKKDNGLLSANLPITFKILSSWQIGILQGSKDIVMSSIFGNVSPDEHEKLVLGPNGVKQLAIGFPNVETWIKRTYMHTFLILPESAVLKDENQEEAIEFVKNVYSK